MKTTNRESGAWKKGAPAGPVLRRQDHRVPILMYHSISDQATARFRRFALRPPAFAEQMAYLQAHDYQPVTVTEFATAIGGAAPGLPSRPVVLTFDDGYADFYSTALPVLLQHGFTGTLYVCTAFVGATSRWLHREGEGNRSMLTWDQLAEIAANGIECASHTHTHPRLDSLSCAEARREIAGSRAVLEQKLARPIASFAYPFGYYNREVRQLVQEAGYSSACAVRYAGSSTGDDVFALARLIVTHNTSLAEFARLLEGRYGPDMLIQRAGARVHAWVRRSFYWGRGLQTRGTSR